MAVFRVDKNRNYTVMSNYHLRDTNMSLKAIGLLSKMLSLADEWDYTTRGLAAICKEGVDAIGAALKELEKCGYLVRRQLRDSHGRIVDTEYTIFEYPHTTSPDTASPDTENPDMVHPDTETPYPKKPAQLSKDKTSPEKENIYPDESGDRNRRLDYVIDRSHPGLVDIFARNLHHSFLLMQPLTKLDVANEAARICEKMKSLREPNSPNGTHFMVQLSPDFMTRASSKDTAALQKWLPYQSLALTGVNGEKGVFAMVDKAEDRTQPLRSPKERKPSVRQKLRQPLPEKTAEKVQKSKTQER